ncbi:flagellar protein FlaG [Sneathiella limimaris]|uniref:flagellar protein FlaG n=1 Tax=Sneathiella limimaris TaxID=1964213 RepID=UPI00146D7E7F|nr:flagellar protein FlaG [Sneathiella limimaris]
MDVAPISKPGIGISDPRSANDTPSAGGPSEDGSVALKPAEFERESQIDDPVRRAEQAIGPFFEDEEQPLGRFSIDQDSDSGRFVYRLINSDTGEILKQFPGDYVLRRVAYYRELEGLAVDNKV